MKTTLEIIGKKIFGITINVTDTFWITLNIAVKLILSIIGSILFARLAGVEYFGKYQYIFSLNSVAALLVLPGIENALINSSAKKTEGDFILAFKKKLSLLPFYILFFLVLNFAIFINTKSFELLLSFFIISILSGYITIFDYHLSYFIGKREYKKLFVCTLMTSFSSITVVLSYFYFSKFIFHTHVPIYALIAVPLLWNACIYTYIFIYIRKRLIYRSTFSDDFLPYAKNLSYISIVKNIQTNIDEFLVGTFFKYESLTFYSIGKKIFMNSLYIWSIALNYLQPRLVGKSIQEAYGYFKKYLKVYWLIIPGIIVFCLLLPSIIKILYGKEFLGASNYAQLFMVIIVISIPAFYLEVYYKANQLYRILYIGRMVDTLSLISFVIFVYLFHAYGIILNRIIATFILSLILILIFLRKMKQQSTQKI
ncbi:MAG: oligosaccharide flippase family protein [Nitrospirota bacterium]